MPVLRTATRVATAKPWLTAVVVVVASGAATGGVLLGSSGGSSATAATSTSRLVAATTSTVSKSVSTTGNLAPKVDEDVSFASSATITSVRVSQGETVTKGQILGTIDDLALKATLAQDRSTLASAKATLSDAKGSDDTTSAQLAADRSQVSTARAAVTSARTALADAVLRAPVSGVVAAVNVSKGDQSTGSGSSGGSAAETASSASASSSGTTSSGDFEIIGTSAWKVTVDVDDTEIGLLAKGQQAQLTTDNHSGTIFGTVTAVSVLPSSDSGSASYPVTVTITGSPSGLHDGAEATVKIIYRQATGVLTVPTLALHRSGSSTFVYLSSDGGRTKQVVKTGLTDGTLTQITSGLKSGEEVYEDVLTPTGTGSSSRSSTDRGGSQQFPGGSGGFSGGGFPGGGSGGGAGGFGGGS